MNTIYEEVKKRLIENNVDFSKYRLFIVRYQAYLDDKPVLGWNLSDDGKYIVIPEVSNSEFADFIGFKMPTPVNLYRIIKEYETFITIGDMSVRTNIYLVEDSIPR